MRFKAFYFSYGNYTMYTLKAFQNALQPLKIKWLEQAGVWAKKRACPKSSDKLCDSHKGTERIPHWLIITYFN